MRKVVREETVPHPYTYIPARGVRYDDDSFEWYDVETGVELPPYFGYGDRAQELVDEWYRERKSKTGSLV